MYSFRNFDFTNLRLSTNNATIRIQNRNVELKLTFEYADHIMHSFIHRNPPHDLEFLNIQRIARQAKFEKKHNRIWLGKVVFRGKMYIIVIILIPKFAVVKSCYYSHYV